MEEAFLFCVVFAVGSLIKEWSERRIERRARRAEIKRRAQAAK